MCRGWLDCFANVFVLFMFGLVVLAGYWTFLDEDIPFASKVINRLPSDATRGQTLMISFDVNYIRRCTVTTKRILINKKTNETVFLGEETITIGETRLGKTIPVSVALTIPLMMTPGEYVYKPTVKYTCNPIQNMLPLSYYPDPQEIVIK
jgi:hypothetical protein